MEHELSGQLFKLTDGVGRIEANQATGRELTTGLVLRVEEMNKTLHESVHRANGIDQKIVALDAVVGKLVVRVGGLEQRPVRMLRWVVGAAGSTLLIMWQLGTPVIRAIAELRLKAWGG